MSASSNAGVGYCSVRSSLAGRCCPASSNLFRFLPNAPVFCTPSLCLSLSIALSLTHTRTHTNTSSDSWTSGATSCKSSLYSVLLRVPFCMCAPSRLGKRQIRPLSTNVLDLLLRPRACYSHPCDTRQALAGKSLRGRGVGRWDPNAVHVSCVSCTSVVCASGQWSAYEQISASVLSCRK